MTATKMQKVHDDKLVMGIGTSIVFDMSEADAVFRKVTAEKGRAEGEAAYRAYMMERVDEPLELGPGFEFVQSYLEHPHHELVICSRNSALTALRAMRSFYKHGLIPNRLFFTNGADIAQYMGAYDVDFFLSTNEADIKAVDEAGTAAALVRHRKKQVEVDDIISAMANRNIVAAKPRARPHLVVADEGGSKEQADAKRSFKAVKGKLRFVYDYDKVLAGPESDDFFAANGLDAYVQVEAQMRNTPMAEGPFFNLYKKQTGINRRAPLGTEPYKISIVTARGGLASFRALNQLAHWDLEPNGEVHFRNGTSKQPVLEIMRKGAPQGSIFFDDGAKNIDAAEAAQMLAGHVIAPSLVPKGA
ncbi:MAG: hypothetical protein EBQ96_00135 [Proteobacteria bacterium]|nr:hypothetical protein [Pseudomonadota bacterium]